MELFEEEVAKHDEGRSRQRECRRTRAHRRQDPAVSHSQARHRRRRLHRLDRTGLFSLSGRPGEEGRRCR